MKHFNHLFCLLKKLLFLLLICILYFVINKRIGCPIRFFCGISCPGCGMTRAWVHVINFDYSGAFHYHPLFWTMPVFAVVFLFDDYIDFSRLRPFFYVTAAVFPHLLSVIIFDPGLYRCMDTSSRCFISCSEKNRAIALPMITHQ